MLCKFAKICLGILFPHKLEIVKPFHIVVPVTFTHEITEEWSFLLTSNTIASSVGISGIYAVSSVACKLNSVTIRPVGKHIITPVSGTHGSINPSDPIFVNNNNNVTLSALPDIRPM